MKAISNIPLKLKINMEAKQNKNKKKVNKKE